MTLLVIQNTSKYRQDQLAHKVLKLVLLKVIEFLEQTHFWNNIIMIYDRAGHPFNRFYIAIFTDSRSVQ